MFYGREEIGGQSISHEYGVFNVGEGALVGLASAKDECELKASNGSRKATVSISPQKPTGGFSNVNTF